MIFTKENLTGLLRENVATITFTKVNGAERIMRCTLLSDYVPNFVKKDGELVVEQSSKNENNVSVWDIDANGWRSFRVSSIKNVQIG